MSISVSNATTLVELIEALKGDTMSNAALADKMGVGATTVHRMLNGFAVSDTVLEHVANYAGLSRERVFSLAKGLRSVVEPVRFSPTVETLARVVEKLPSDLQELLLIQARALSDAREQQKH